MVVPTDAQAAFIVGAFFVDAGRKYIKAEHAASPERSRLVYARFRQWAVLYPALCLVPVIVVFFCAWPAWETQYWTGYAERLPGNGGYALFAGLFLFLVTAAGFWGNYLAFRWLLSGREKLIRPVYVTVLLLTLLIYFYQWPGPVRLGSVARFRADPAALPYIWQDGGFFFLYCALLLYCIVPPAVIYFKIRRAVKGS